MHENIWELDTIYRHAWDRLCVEIDHGSNPFRRLQFATVGLNGCPRVRTVVLRRADRKAGTLTFHTDIRSDKFAELQGEPRVSLVGLDTICNVQICIEGEAVLFTDGSERKLVWDAIPAQSKRLYQRRTPAGTPSEAPPQAYLSTRPRIRAFLSGGCIDPPDGVARSLHRHTPASPLPASRKHLALPMDCHIAPYFSTRNAVCAESPFIVIKPQP